MKTLAGGMSTMAAGRARTLAWTVQFTRRDAQVFRFVSASRDLTVGGNLYTAAPGFSVSSLTCTAGFEVDTAKLTILTNDDMVKADFLTGRWDGCRVDFNQADWATPANGFIPWPFYRVSDVQPIDGGFELELRDGRQLWRRDYTLSTGKTCRNRLGDARCGVNLATFSFAFTVSAVASRAQFTAAALAQADDYFSEGYLVFSSGFYAGLKIMILDHDAGGIIKLGESLIEDVVIGATGTITAGCLKRIEDCATKFSNILNMRAPGLHAGTAAELVGA